MPGTVPNPYRVIELMRARRRIRPGLYTMKDGAGRPWTIERLPSGEWLATQDGDRYGYLDPLPTLKRAMRAVAQSDAA